jgi:hypothetical protein
LPFLAWANVNGVISMAGSLARHISAVASQSELELSPTKPSFVLIEKEKEGKSHCNLQCKTMQSNTPAALSEGDFALTWR